MALGDGAAEPLRVRRVADLEDPSTDAARLRGEEALDPNAVDRGPALVPEEAAQRLRAERVTGRISAAAHRLPSGDRALVHAAGGSPQLRLPIGRSWHRGHSIAGVS